MKSCFFIGSLFGCLLFGIAQGEPARPFPPGEAVCGYAGSYLSLAAGQVKQGLSVEMLAGDALASQPVPLRFRVSQKPRGMPVDDLQVEHEKLMHVIAVREDLGAFVHLHPQRAAPGLWEIIHTFTDAGRYQIWSDIKHRGTVYSFAHPRLTVGENSPQESRVESLNRVAPPLQEPFLPPQGFGVRQSSGAFDDPRLPKRQRTGALQDADATQVGLPVRRASGPKLTAETDGFHLTLQPTSSTLITGRTNSFEVIIRDRLGNQVGTEFFLGALMHLIIVKDDLSTYAHAHAVEHLKSREPVSFQHTFPRPGDYKIFAQFRPQKTKLPPDEALLAEFWVRVEWGN